MKVLLVTRTLNQKQNDGGSIVSKRNYRMLCQCCGYNNIDTLEIKKVSNFIKLRNLLFREDYGVTKPIKKAFVDMVENTKYDFVFFNSSLYGELVKICATKNILTIVFYHNVEFKYYRAMFHNYKNFLSYVFSTYIKSIEKKSTIYSDFRIALTDRDAAGINDIYKKPCDLILPISMPMRNISVVRRKSLNKNCAFIGSDFFANCQGIYWFIEKVLPFIDCELILAGSICNAVSAQYPDRQGIHFVGYVDNLDSFYYDIDFIVSPIFAGSGMKTKTVEALSYGKSVVGTEEAFVGIIADFNKIGGFCNTAEDFISCINGKKFELFNKYSYSYFKQNLSDDNIFEKFNMFCKAKNIFGN